MGLVSDLLPPRPCILAKLGETGETGEDGSKEEAVDPARE